MRLRRPRLVARFRGLPCLVAGLTVLAAVLGAGSGAGPAAAATGSPARLTVDAGDAGVFIPGRPMPVRVQVDGDRLIRGQVVVTAGSAQVAEPVEVAGGSSKRFELVVPTFVGQNPLSLRIALTDGGAQVASVNATVNAAPDVELVGLVPGLLAGQPLPSPVPLSIDIGTARFVALTEQDLALAPASLGPLTAVALGPDDLGRFGSSTRQALAAWTAAGGRLMIDARPDDKVTGLPAGWQLHGTGRVSAGRGEVVLTAGAMAAGNWANLVQPASHVSDAPQAAFNGMSEPLSNSLAADAGLRIPRLPWLIVFLGIYIAVVGPVGFLVSRRLGHAELLWVVIPVVALVFAATGYVVGAKERSGVKIVHATVIDTTAGGGTALSYVAVVSRGEATARFDAPAGWVMERFTDNGGPQFVGPGADPGAGLTSAVASDGLQGRLTMSAGQFAVVAASGPAHFPGQLTVTARSTSDGHAEGAVTNNTAWSLQDVSVLIGTAGADVGTLAPGAQAHWTISDNNSNGGIPVELQLWGQTSSSAFGNAAFAINGPMGFIGPAGKVVIGGSSGGGSSVQGSRTRPVSLSVWQAAPGGLAPGSRGTGVAVAVGWSNQIKSAVSVGGHGPVASGRTAVVGTSPVDAADAGVGDLAIQRSVLRGALTQVGPGQFIDTGNSGLATVVGWSVPAAAGGRALTLSVPANTGRIEVWGSRGWRVVTEGTNVGARMGNGALVVPAVPVPVPSGPMITSPPPGLVSPPQTAAAIPFMPPGFNTGPTTQYPLQAGDLHDGAVYARVASPGSGGGQPFNLDALAVKVAA